MDQNGDASSNQSLANRDREKQRAIIPLSLDAGAHSVGRRRVDHQNYIHCASPSEAARQINIDLIEANEVALRAGKGDCGVRASYPGLHRRETTVELDSCAEQ